MTILDKYFKYSVIILLIVSIFAIIMAGYDDNNIPLLNTLIVIIGILTFNFFATSVILILSWIKNLFEL